jgi:hypothetical protein
LLQGQLYLKKATVLDVLAPMHGEIVVDDTGRHVNVMQQELETYVPKAPGTRVRSVAQSWQHQAVASKRPCVCSSLCAADCAVV